MYFLQFTILFSLTFGLDNLFVLGGSNEFQEHFTVMHKRSGKLVTRSVMDVDFQRSAIPIDEIQIVGQEDRRGQRVKRDEPTASPPPPTAQAELRPDEIAADPSKFVTVTIDESVPYPKMVTPNVTCVTSDDMKTRLRSVTPIFAPRPKKKCPKKLPCQQFNSCSIWRTGMVTKTYAIDKNASTTFYNELFVWLHGSKINLLMTSLEECVKFYGLDQPFSGKTEEEEDRDTTEPNEPEAVGHTHKLKKKTKKHKVTRRQVPEDATPTSTINPNIEDDGVEGSGTETPDSKVGLSDCRARLEDFLECFDTIMIKGLCYWPTIELA